MDYKKMYEEALERAKYLKENTDSVNAKDISCTFEYIFPELSGSEDERIRKAIGYAICQSAHSDGTLTNGITSKEALAWLEKQGEQKSIKQDTEIHDLWVYIREWNDKFGRLPKDEDELEACIDYVTKRQKPSEKVEQSCYHNDGLYYAIDILEKTFGKVEGYQSDNGKMEHQTAIETVNALYHKKPAEWSEEDEKMFDKLYEILYIYGYSSHPEIDLSSNEAINLIYWLKSLKPNHWKPSEQNIKDLEWCADLVKDKMGVGFHRLQVFIDELKNNK